MKKCLLFLSVFLLLYQINAQTTSKTLSFGGLTRSYIEHVPVIYNPSEPVPLIICLHGLGDNMTNFTGIGMHQLANTQNFIVITPQAVNSPFGTAWNSGASLNGYQLNATIDDIGFISALIDSTMSLYNIDEQRVYAMGFSMGGFMCNRLACQLNNRIAAIGSVAGTIGASISCNPGRAVPVIHLHGTGDETVFYSGNSYGMDAMDMVMFWVNNNNCDTTPVINDVPDIAQDGFTIKHFLFENGDDSTTVEHYRVDSCAHQWIYPPNNDMSYTLAIWEFVSKYKLPEWVNIENKHQEKNITVFPNPASEYVRINVGSSVSSKIEIIDMYGKLIFANDNYESGTLLNISNFKNGVYILKVYDTYKRMRQTSFKIIVNN